jgi:hypothetical protein
VILRLISHHFVPRTFGPLILPHRPNIWSRDYHPQSHRETTKKPDNKIDPAQSGQKNRPAERDRCLKETDVFHQPEKLNKKWAES